MLSTKTDWTVAAVQMCSTEDVTRNLHQAGQEVEAAALRGAHCVVLPENFGFLAGEGAKRKWAAPLAEHAFLAPAQAWAKKHGIWLVAGGLPEASTDPNRPFNTAVVINKEGQIAAAYRKIHLFDVQLLGADWTESAGVTPGDSLVCVDMDGFCVGLSICYDLRFGELYRMLRAQGADILLAPAAFTHATGAEHWEVLLRARAIENQCYVVAANQWGNHGDGRRSWGHSMVVDPLGAVVAQAPEGIGAAVVPCSATQIAATRKAMPLESHRRLIEQPTT